MRKLSSPPRAVILASAAIVAFLISLLVAGSRLVNVERALEKDVTEDMSWTVLQAQMETFRFYEALSRYVSGYSDVGREYLQFRYSLLGSRLSLMTEGQPRRHLEKAEVYEVFSRHAGAYDAAEKILADLTRGDRQREEELRTTLEPLNIAIREIVNRSFIAARKWKSDQRVQHRTHTVETLFYMLATLASGFGLTALIIRGRQEVAAARDAARREREMTRVYRTLVSIVSHQFRTPLAIIDSSAQRLKRRAGSIQAAEVATRADYIRQATNGLLQLMDTTLDAARLDAGEIRFRPRPTDLRWLIHALCDRNRDAHDLVGLDVDTSGLPPVVRCDAVLMEQALSNLLMNAIKYSNCDDAIRVRAWEEAGDIFISIEDGGIGIPHDELELVFEQFFRGRLTQDRPGAGIGLSFVRQIVRLHHGEIDVTSGEGGGSTFTLRFPHVSENHARNLAVSPSCAGALRKEEVSPNEV